MRVINCDQGTDEWLSIRRGVITGTRLEGAFKQSDALKNEILAERMASFCPSTGMSADMQRGNDLEPFARKEYEAQTGNKVEEVGFILHPERDDIGLSPDGIVNGGLKGVEFKCPKSATHIEYMRSGMAPKKYLFQLLSYFLNVPQMESIDFVSYDELNEIKCLCITTLTLDDLLSMEYLKNKRVGTMEALESKVFEFADSIHYEYNRLIF